MNVAYFIAGYTYGLFDVYRLFNMVNSDKVFPIGPLSISYKASGLDFRGKGSEGLGMIAVCFASLIIVPPIYGGLSIWLMRSSVGVTSVAHIRNVLRL